MRLTLRLLFLLLICVASSAVPCFSASDASTALDRLNSQLFTNVPAEANAKKANVLVLPFESSQDLTRRRVGFAVSEVLKSRLLSSGKIVVETPLAQKAIREAGIQSNEFDNDAALKMAKSLNADYVVVGSIQDSGSKYQVNSRLLSTTDQTLVSPAYEEIPKESFDDYASAYLSEGVSPAVEVKKEKSAERVTDVRRRGGKLGFDAFWADVHHENSKQFKEAGAPLGMLRLWLSNAIAIEGGGAIWDQKIKDHFLFQGSVDVISFFVGTQLRVDKGQRFVPYVGGGGVILRATGASVNQNIAPCNAGGRVYCDEEIDPTSYGNYLNLGVTGYLSENRNWSVTIDYRKINVDLDSKISVTTYTSGGPFGPGTVTVESAQEKVPMDMRLLSIGLGYHF